MSDDPTAGSTTAPEPITEQPAPSAAPPVRHRSGVIWWGVALIGVGGVLLVSQFLPGVELWRYWPLIIVAIGVRGMFGSGGGRWSMKSAAEGLTVAAVGAVFLGQTLGYLSWGVWLDIFRLWPVLLISFGLEIIGKGLRADWLRALASIVVIAALAYGALAMTPASTWPPAPVGGADASRAYSMSTDRSSGVKEGEAHIEAGVSEFSLAGGTTLASASGRSRFPLRYKATDDGRTADVEIGLLGAHTGLVERSELNVTLSNAVVWDLDVSTGVSSFGVDLTDVQVSELDFETGVSEGTLTLGPSGAGGWRGRRPAKIKGGVSSLTIRVPERDDVRATVRSGLSSIVFDDTWNRVDAGDRRVYESAGFSGSGAYWDIAIDAGIGAITVEYY